MRAPQSPLTMSHAGLSPWSLQAGPVNLSSVRISTPPKLQISGVELRRCPSRGNNNTSSSSSAIMTIRPASATEAVRRRAPLVLPSVQPALPVKAQADLVSTLVGPPSRVSRGVARERRSYVRIFSETETDHVRLSTRTASTVRSHGNADPSSMAIGKLGCGLALSGHGE